jgi:hypothetical protein
VAEWRERKRMMERNNTEAMVVGFSLFSTFLSFCDGYIFSRSRSRSREQGDWILGHAHVFVSLTFDHQALKFHSFTPHQSSHAHVQQRTRKVRRIGETCVLVEEKKRKESSAWKLTFTSK